jgi:hypothetical protein
VPAEKVSSLIFYFLYPCPFWHCPKKKEKSLVRLNLSTRIRLNFRLARKALKSPIKPSRQPPAQKTDRPTRRLNTKMRSCFKTIFQIKNY